MNKNNAGLRRLAPFLIVFAAILWGFDGIVRVSLYTLPPIIIVFFEHLIGFLIISPFLWGARKAFSLTTTQWFAIAWVSLLSGLLGTLWFTTALVKTEFIPFSVVFLLQKLQPLFAIATASILLKEKITKRYLLWVVPALIAGFFMTFPDGRVDLVHPGTLSAALFALGAAVAWGSSTAVSRYALVGQSETVITGLRFFFTSIFSLVALILMGQTAALSSPDTSQLFRLVFIALSTGMVAIWFYYKGLKFTEAKISTMLELALPLTAIVIDILWFKNTLQPIQYLSALVLFFCVYQVSRLHKA